MMKLGRRTPALLALIAFAVVTATVLRAPPTAVWRDLATGAPGRDTTARDIYVLAVEFKGMAKGAEIEVYRWDSGTIVVRRGEAVNLHFFGVNGDIHRGSLEPYVADFTVRRGEWTTLSFTADRPGIFALRCHTHPPEMTAWFVVLESR